MTHQGLSALSSSGYSTTSLRSPAKTQTEHDTMNSFFNALSKDGQPKRIHITPDLAEFFLTKNVFPNQRKMSEHRVKSLAGSLIRGEWKFTGQGITFDKKGRLLDGQQRLAAIVKSQVAVDMVVAFNADEEAFRCIDNNMKLRSLADVTHLSNAVAQIMSFAFYMLPGRGIKPTADQIINLYNTLHPIIGDDIQKMAKSTKRFYSTSSARTAMLLRLATANQQEKDYIHSLYSKIVSASPACYAELPVIALAYKADFENKRVDNYGGDIVRKTFFAYAWVVYNPANKNKKTIGIYSKDYNKKIAKINAHYDEGRKVLYELVGKTQRD